MAAASTTAVLTSSLAFLAVIILTADCFTGRAGQPKNTRPGRPSGP